MKGKQVIKALEQAGWVLKGVRGSHHFMTKDGKKVPVPVHGGSDIGTGLLAKIQKQTGVMLK